MKAEGIRLERETVIVFNEEDDMASIWTASDVIYRKLLKLKWIPEKDEERSATFSIPKGRIKLPKPLSKVKSEAMRARRATRSGATEQETPIPGGANGPA